MPAPRTPLRQQHLIPVGLVLAIAMLSYFAHLVNLAVQRGATHRSPVAAIATPAATATVDETDTIAFAVHTLAPAPH